MLRHYKLGARVRVKEGPNAGKRGSVYDATLGESKVQLDGDNAGVWWDNDKIEPCPISVLLETIKVMSDAEREELLKGMSEFMCLLCGSGQPCYCAPCYDE